MAHTQTEPIFQRLPKETGPRKAAIEKACDQARQQGKPVLVEYDHDPRYGRLGLSIAEGELPKGFSLSVHDIPATGLDVRIYGQIHSFEAFVVPRPRISEE